MDFSSFFDVVFPALGEFFGILSAVATVTISDLFSWLYGTISLSYINVFSGVAGSIPSLAGLSSPISGVLRALGYPVYIVIQGFVSLFNLSSMPVWACFLILTPTFVLLFALIKWLLDIVH